MTSKKFATYVAIILASLVMTMSCEENSGISKSTNVSSPSQKNRIPGQPGSRISNYTFNGTEGDPITLDVASSWFVNYNTKNVQSATSHFFGSSVLKKILAVSGSMGIRIYYSIDDAGNKQLLLIGADSQGNDLLPKSGAKGISSSLDLSGGIVADSFTGTEEDWVSDEVSIRWIANYAAQNPLGLTAHFFGYEILNQILNQSGCIGIRMYYALNDSGVQQVLLVGVSGKGENILPTSLTGGKVTEGGGTIGDASFPCPSYCGG